MSARHACLRLRLAAILAAAGALAALVAGPSGSVLPAALTGASDSYPLWGMNHLRSGGLVTDQGWPSGSGAADLTTMQTMGVGLYRASLRLDVVSDDGADDTSGWSWDGSRAKWGLSYDALIRAAADRDITVLPILLDYSATGLPHPATTATDLARFSRFAAAAAARYGPHGSFWATYAGTPRPIRAWEIWNEENHSQFWGSAPDPTSYATLLRAAHSGLRSVDDTARVVIGGLIYGGGGVDLDAVPFLDAVMDAGGTGSFDAVGVHPYTMAAYGDGAAVASSAMAHVDWVANALLAHDGGQYGSACRCMQPRHQVWATEFGWTSHDPANPYQPTEATQADELAHFIPDWIARRAADNLGPALWFDFRDQMSFSNRDDALGLRRTTGAGADAGAKPAFPVFQAAAQQGFTVALPQLQSVAPPALAVAPQLHGSAVQGGLLTVSTGSWTSDSPFSLSVQWQRCAAACTAVSGGTGTAYAITATDSLSRLRAAVMARNAAGATTFTTTMTAVVPPPAPANTSAPSIVGTPEVGVTVRAKTGQWTWSPTAYTYAWLRCTASGCSAIAGATSAAYTLQPGDAGAPLRVHVTASNSGGSGAAESAPTRAVSWAATFPQAPAGQQVTSCGSGCLRQTWDPLQGADGYTVVIKSAGLPDDYRLATTAGFTWTSLPAGRWYHLSVRGHRYDSSDAQALWAAEVWIYLG